MSCTVCGTGDSTLQLAVTGGSGGCQCETLEEEVVSVSTTEGSDQLQGEESQKVLQCSLPSLEAVLRGSEGPGIVWLCILSPLEAVVRCSARHWKEWQCCFLPLEV